MKVTLKGKENNEVSFTIEFSADEFDAATQKAYLAERGRITIDGFRKGKAPRSIIERAYGPAVFFETAIDNLLKENYEKSLDELKIDPISSPSIDLGEEKLEQHKGFTVNIKVTVPPEVDLKNYKGIEFEFEEQKVGDEDLERELQGLRQKNARLLDSNEAAKLTDSVVLDYKGFVGDDQFAGGTADNYTLKLGSNTFIPGFEDQLVGVKPGDEKDVVVTFPEDYSAENLAGKEAVFKCTIHEVKREELPELDDEFAKDVSSFDTLEELKNDIKANLEKAAAESNDYVGKNKAMLALCDANPIDIPQVMIDDEINQMYNDYLQRLINQGISPDAVRNYLKNAEEKIKENFKEDAKARVHTSLLVKAVAEKEKIEATDEELEKEYEDLAKQYGIAPEDAKKSLAGSENYIKEDIVYRKAVQFIFDNAKKIAPKKESK